MPGKEIGFRASYDGRMKIRYEASTIAMVAASQKFPEPRFDFESWKKRSNTTRKQEIKGGSRSASKWRNFFAETDRVHALLRKPFEPGIRSYRKFLAKHSITGLRNMPNSGWRYAQRRRKKRFFGNREEMTAAESARWPCVPNTKKYTQKSRSVRQSARNGYNGKSGTRWPGYLAEETETEEKRHERKDSQNGPIIARR